MWWGLHDTLVPLDSTYGSPGPQKWTNNFFSSDYLHILHVVERIYLVSNLFQNVYGALKHILHKVFMNSVDHVYWATGGYICGCRRPSNLVFNAPIIYCALYFWSISYWLLMLASNIFSFIKLIKLAQTFNLAGCLPILN